MFSSCYLAKCCGFKSAADLTAFVYSLYCFCHSIIFFQLFAIPIAFCMLSPLITHWPGRTLRWVWPVVCLSSYVVRAWRFIPTVSLLECEHQCCVILWSGRQTKNMSFSDRADWIRRMILRTAIWLLSALTMSLTHGGATVTQEDTVYLHLSPHLLLLLCASPSPFPFFICEHLQSLWLTVKVRMKPLFANTFKCLSVPFFSLCSTILRTLS